MPSQPPRPAPRGGPGILRAWRRRGFGRWPRKGLAGKQWPERLLEHGDVLSQRRHQLTDALERKNNARNDLSRRREIANEVDGEVVAALQNERAGGQYAAADAFGDARTDGRMGKVPRRRTWRLLPARMFARVHWPCPVRNGEGNRSMFSAAPFRGTTRLGAEKWTSPRGVTAQALSAPPRKRAERECPGDHDTTS